MDGTSILLTTAAAALTGLAAYLAADMMLRPYPKPPARLTDYEPARLPDAASDRPGGVPVRRLGQFVAGLVGTADDQLLLLKLRQAGMLQHLDRHDRARAFRTAQLRDAALFALTGAAAGWSMSTPAVGAALALLLAGLGAGRLQGQLDRKIAARAERMRAELYSVNHLIAMRLQAGSSVRAALPPVAERGSGPVCEELREALRAHASGTTLSQALTNTADITCEPNAAATYRLLAQGTTLGNALSDTLLELSRTLRQDRVEEIKRLAIKRGNRMLLPTMLLLAPMMLLFVGAAMLHVMGGVF